MLESLNHKGYARSRRQHPVPPLKPLHGQREQHAQGKEHGNIQQGIQPDLECKGVPRFPKCQKWAELDTHSHSAFHAVHKRDCGQPAQIAQQQQNRHGLSPWKTRPFPAAFPVQRDKQRRTHSQANQSGRDRPSEHIENQSDKIVHRNLPAEQSAYLSK